MTFDILPAASTKLRELLESGLVLDRMYADFHGGINFRGKINGKKGRWHITNLGYLLDRNPPADYTRSTVRRTEYLDYYGEV